MLALRSGAPHLPWARHACTPGSKFAYDKPAQAPDRGPEPDPTPTAVVELAPPPRVEPDPAPTAIVELARPPAVEPAPALTTIVELMPVPASEPPPRNALVRNSMDVATSVRLATIMRPPPQAPPALQVQPDWSEDETNRFLHELEGIRARGGTALCGSSGRGRDPAGPPFVVHGRTLTARWVERTLHGVIANACQSKTYQDILALDGGTVGICHFASGSLRILYAEMDTMRYFGVPASRIPDRPYRLAWWREGMRRFLESPEGRAAQQRAWRTYIGPALGVAMDHGWQSERQLAIAAGIANSLGAAGFTALAQQSRWEPEQTLLSYSRLSSHKQRRRLRLNFEFPKEPHSAPPVGPYAAISTP